MAKITILDTPKVTLWYHPDEKIIHHCVHKFVYGEEFHTFLLKGTELMKKNGAHKWLSNDESNTVFREEDLEWGKVNWFTQTVAAGWKYWAIVQPKALAAKVNMDDLVILSSKTGILTKIFFNEEDAWSWLAAQV